MARLSIDIPIIPKLASGAWNQVITTLRKGTSSVSSEASRLFGGLGRQFADGQKVASDGGGMFGDIANRLGQLASPAGAATAAITALTFAFTQTVSIGKEYEKQLAAVGAITGITGNALDELGGKARNLATTFGGPATDQLKLFQFTLSKFGPDLAKTPTQLAEVARNINLLGKAGGLDAARSTEALANSMLQFGVNVNNANVAASESGRFINVLAASARVGAAEIGQVTEAVLQAGVSAKQLKISFEETNAAVQALAIGGKVGSEAGVGLRNVLTSLVTGGEKQQAILQQMGLSYKSLGDSLSRSGLAATLGLLRDGMNKLSTDAERSAALAALFGKENLASAGILLDQVETIKRWTKEITGTNDALVQAAINMNTFDDRLKVLTSNIQDYAISAYQKLGPALNQSFDFLAESLGKLAPEISPAWTQQFAMIREALASTYETLKPLLGVLAANTVGTFVVSLTATFNALNVAFTITGQIAKSIGEILRPIGVALGLIDENATQASDPVQSFASLLGTITTTMSEAGKAATQFSGIVIKYITMPIKGAVFYATELVKWLLSFSSTAGNISSAASALANAFRNTSTNMLASAEASKKFVEQQIEANKEQQKSAQTTATLVREYQNLASQKSLTAQETRRLYEIQQTLDRQYPALIDQTKSFRENLSGVAEIGKQTTNSMGLLAKQSEQLQKQLESANRNIAYAKRNVAIDELRDTLGSFSLFGIGNENKFREQFAQAREIYVNELFGAKTQTDVLAAQGKIFEKLNDLNKQGLFKDNKKIAELYELISKAAQATQQTMGDVKEEAKKGAEEVKKTVSGTVSLDVVLDKTKKKSDKSAKEAARTQLDIFKDQLKAAKEAADISEQNLRVGLTEKALSEQRKLNKKEELSILSAGTDELEKQINLLVTKYKAAVQDGRAVSIGVAIDKKNQGDVLNGINNLILELQKKRLLLIKKSDKEELLDEARDTLDAVRKEVESLPLSAFVPAKEISDAVREAVSDKTTTVPIEPTVSAAAKDKLQEAIKRVKPKLDIDLTPERKSSITLFTNEIAKTLDDAVKRFEDGLAGAIKRFKASVQDKNGGFTKSSFSLISGEVSKADELAAQLQADGLVEVFAERLRKQRDKIQSALLDADSDETKAKLQEQLAEVERLQREVLERIREKQAEYRRKRQEAEIAAIEDDAERELAQTIISLERQRDEEIKKAREVGIATTGIATKYTRQINEVRRKFNEQAAQESAASWANSFGEAASNLGTSLAKPYSQLSAEQTSAAQQSLKSIEEEKKATLKRFLIQKSTADEYYSSLRELNAKQQEEMAKFQPPNVWAEFRNNALTAFRDIAEAQRAFILETLTTLGGYLKERNSAESSAAALREERDAAVDAGNMTRAQELNKEYLSQLNTRGKAEKKSADALIGVYSSVALAVGSALSSAIAASESAGRAVVRTLFDTLQATVPIVTAMIFGVSSASPANIATLGAWGAAQFIGLTLALQALVAAARAAAGFETGGLVRGKEKLIRVNERGEEFVMNSKATQKNLAALAYINRENITIEEYVRRTSPASSPKVDIPVVQLAEIQRYLHNELSVRDQQTNEMANELRALNQTVTDVKTVLTARRPTERHLVEVQASRDFNARLRRRNRNAMMRRT